MERNRTQSELISFGIHFLISKSRRVIIIDHFWLKEKRPNIKFSVNVWSCLSSSEQNDSLIMKTSSNLTFSRNFLRLRGYYGMVCRYDIRSISGTVHSPRFPQNILLFENREILRHFVSLHRFFNSVKCVLKRNSQPILHVISRFWSKIVLPKLIDKSS